MVCFYFLLKQYDCKVKIQYWLNEVFMIGYNYHKKGIKDLNYALKFVVEGLIWKNCTAIKHHFTVHCCDFDRLIFSSV